MMSADQTRPVDGRAEARAIVVAAGADISENLLRSLRYRDPSTRHHRLRANLRRKRATLRAVRPSRMARIILGTVGSVGRPWLTQPSRLPGRRTHRAHLARPVPRPYARLDRRRRP